MSLLPNHGHIHDYTVIRRSRTLPRPGEILKRPGQPVKPLDVVARAIVPQDHHIIDITKRLHVPVDKVNRYILKQPGEPVEPEEPIAARRQIAGLRRIMVRSPIQGEVVEVGGGIVILEGEPALVEVKASIPGEVAEVLSPWGVVIETRGARLQLAWGHGELIFSELKILVPPQEGEFDPNVLDDMEHRSAILFIPAPLTEELLQAAVGVNAAGLIGSSMDAGLIPLVEEIDLTVGLTEGFGRVHMSIEAANLLRTNNGREITLDPETSGHWRGSRPEIIISLPEGDAQASIPQPDELLQVGDSVHLLRGPYRGAVGKVTALPKRPRRVPSGLRLMGAEVALEDNVTTFVPFANLEHLG